MNIYAGISLYSVLMSLVWNGLAVTTPYAVRYRRTNAVVALGVSPLVILVTGCLLRCVLPLEIPGFTIVIPSSNLYTEINTFLYTPISLKDILGWETTPLKLFVVVWLTGVVVIFFCQRWNEKTFYGKIEGYLSVESGPMYELLQKVAQKRGIEKVALCQATSIPVPMMAGFFHPILLMPADEYSEEALTFIFEHEVQHWVNHDRWFRLFIQLFCTLFWWDPFVYLARADLNLALEIKCDIAVVGDKPKEVREFYVDILGKVLFYQKERAEREETSIPYTVSQFVPVKKLKRLQRRLTKPGRLERFRQRGEMILHYHPNKRRDRIASALSYLVLLVYFVVSYSFIFQPQYKVPEEEFTSNAGVEELTSDNSYLVQDKDGSYSFYIHDELFAVLPPQKAQQLLEDGFELRTE